MNNAASLKNQFLLAMPELRGSYFGNSITYLCEHNNDGALGLMINRPTDMRLGELFDQLDIHGDAHRDVIVLEGGPVQQERGFILHTDELQGDASLPIADGLMLSTAREILDAISRGEGPRHFLVTLGYAGWGGGQLEGEMRDNAWLTCPADTDIIFTVPLEERVQRAADQLGIDFNLISNRAGHA